MVAKSPAPVAELKVSTPVLKASEVLIDIHNPLKETIEFRVTLEVSL